MCKDFEIKCLRIDLRVDGLKLKLKGDTTDSSVSILFAIHQLRELKGEFMDDHQNALKLIKQFTKQED
jgi:hypothetical protein